MQPYIFPYIGYFQLMNAVDEFVVYDNIEYTKKGWINRNRILVNGADAYISFPLKKDSDYLHVNQRYLAESWPDERKKLLNKISGSYRKSSQFNSVFPIIEKAITFDNNNLFEFTLHSIRIIREYLEIPAKLVISSTIPVNHELKGAEKVIAICKARQASEYWNPIGGVELYDRGHFRKESIELHFLKTGEIRYAQFNHEFIPYLSIIDVLMFNPKEVVMDYLNTAYTVQ